MLFIRTYRVFQYHAVETARLDRPGPQLCGPAGQELGAVERISVEAGRLTVRGRAAASRVALRQGAAESSVDLEPCGPDGQARFVLDLPYAPGSAQLVVQHAMGTLAQPLAGFSDRQVRLARARRFLPFCAKLIRLAPVIWRWKRRGDLGARERVKEALNLVPPSPAGALDPAVLDPTPAPPVPIPGAFIIVMPVYNALELLREALERVERHSPPGWHLVAVEDLSTDPAVRPWLQAWAWARPDRVTLILNETNLGFVAAVNRGLSAARAHDPKAPVVLLNSDALVPADWAARLLAPLTDPTVASVTPFSNDAEIFTVPVVSHRVDLQPGEGDALAKEAVRINAATSQVDLPTGVGFCMALSPRYLADIPAFDPAFGRGYGEEVDWCRKAIQAGGRHVAAADLFVEHRGGASFGSAAKQALLQRNAGIISRRYPGFDAEVRRFVAADPLVTARMALGLSLAAARAAEPVPVWLAHAMGGGAEVDLQNRISARTGAGESAVVLRVGRGWRWTLELHGPNGMTAGISDALEIVQALIGRLPRRRIIYSCGVGDRDPVSLPRVLLALAGRGPQAVGPDPQPIEILLHDYFPVSPSYTLLDCEGVWRGVPLPDSPAGRDPAHYWRGPEGSPTDLAAWQAEWGVLLAAASRIEVFSEASREILCTAYPSCRTAIIIRPHTLPVVPPKVRPGVGADGVPVIGVLGNIGPQKGADVLVQLSRTLARSAAARLVVIGRLAPEYALAAPARVHGRYRIDDLPGLVARYGITAWLVPSVWPETFSFTTHEALATGLPVLAFDLGAQGAAVRAARNGTALPCPGPDGMDVAALLAALLGTWPP